MPNLATACGAAGLQAWAYPLYGFGGDVLEGMEDDP